MHLEPIVSFAVLLAVILIVPLCFERLKLPGLLGLLLAGVVLGPSGLQILQSESDTMKLLSDIGLVYLLFVAGLEIDLEQFRATKHRSAGFGFLTFIVPLITGTLVGRLFGFDWNASVLIGSLFASHTLLAYPIISRLGVINNEAIVVTIGATIFTDIGSLMVLAVCLGVHEGEFSAFKLVQLLSSLLIYSVIILFGFSALGREFFRRSGDEEGNQFLFVLLVVFVSALGAEVIGVEKIVGAFLAGLAVNSVTDNAPIKEKILFVGTVLFIPIFFVDIGLLINIPAFIKSIASIWLPLIVVIGLIGSKFLAAVFAKFAYHYSWREAITMWSLSMPQVAATLAATFVGYRAGMLTEDMLNSVIVLMLVTATLGPIITARAARGLLSTTNSTLEPNTLWTNTSLHPSLQSPTIVVPVYNPKTERHLIEMATLLSRHQASKVVPLSITVDHLHMDALELEDALRQSRSLLVNAVSVCQEFGIAAEPLLRIDDGIAEGISRASLEQSAGLIIMGWGRATGLRARLFGSIIDRVLWSAHCSVAVTRLLDSPEKFKHILVPIKHPNQSMVRVMNFAAILADTNQAEVTLLHICDRHTSPDQVEWLKARLELLISKCSVAIKPVIQIVIADNVAATIVKESRLMDLVVMRSVRRRVNVHELSISDLTTQVISRLGCSIVMLSEPQHRRHLPVKAD
ncbi:MAG: universal stress protein [Leptolyngbyaceae cyanobacterium CRU_2_3]|nr:universal stress protein [Leptolyngbyaceae cyanobacterium CRU_2_3]